MSMICCGTKASRISSYKPHHTPPWILSLFFALQHLLVQASLLCACHSLLLQSRPLPPSDQISLLASSLFACGIATGLQSSLGTRLPLVQSPTFELLIPAVILNRHSTANRTELEFQGNANCTGTDCDQRWSDIQPIREVSGALIIAGVLQILSGLSGLWKWILRLCGPMVIAPTLSIIGLSCYKAAAQFCSSNWSISMSLVVVIAFLSQTLRSLHFPVFTWNKKEGLKRRYAPVFRMLSMFLPISFIWIMSIYWDHQQMDFPSEIRLVPNTSLLTNRTRMYVGGQEGSSEEFAPWFRFPTLGAWGWPKFSLETLGVGTAMALTSCISSLGCYILCSRMLSCPPLPSHSCNRGICLEGFGNIISGLLGSVCGVGSNIPTAGMTGITQVGSRQSALLSALLFIVLGCCPRLSQMLMSIPFAVHGATLCLTFSMAVGGGVSFFQYADIDSGRNIFIVGFTMFMALLVPRWLEARPTILDTGWPAADMFLLSLLTTPIFLGGVFSFILDNTVEVLGQSCIFFPISSQGRPSDDMWVFRPQGVLDCKIKKLQLLPAPYKGTLEERGVHKSTLLWPFTFSDPTRRGQEEEMAQAYGLPCTLSHLIPTMYPFNQLCPPPSESVAIAQGEEHKLLSIEATASDAEQGRV